MKLDILWLAYHLPQSFPTVYDKARRLCRANMSLMACHVLVVIIIGSLMIIMHKCETTNVTNDAMTLPMIMCHFGMNDIRGLTNGRYHKRDLC